MIPNLAGQPLLSYSSSLCPLCLRGLQHIANLSCYNLLPIGVQVALMLLLSSRQTIKTKDERIADTLPALR